MEQISKNTVKSTNQLKDSEYIFFENAERGGLRVMFVGNSITLHGIRPEIGWHGLYGMAASKKENDYVHILMRKIKKTDPDAAFCICQVCEWETDYKKGEEKFHLYESARDFGADIIIMRAVENCPLQDFNEEVFIKAYDRLIDYLNPDKKAKIMVTSSFWKHPADKVIEAYAKERNLPFASLGDLGELDEMKAVGKFEHSGVASHPGDLGMKTIAERIQNGINNFLGGKI